MSAHRRQLCCISRLEMIDYRKNEGRFAMFSITLITMGKLKEKFYISAAEEYKSG